MKTLATVLRSAFAAGLLALALTLVLGELGVNIGPLLAAAGVAGLAIGFGAQSLVRDFLNGFFFLLEGQVRVGDIVEAGGKSGVVEAMTLRTLTLRDFAGRVHIIPHGEISAVTNYTRDFSRAVIEVGVAYREDAERVLDLLREEAAAMAADPEFAGTITGEPEVFGIDEFGDSALLFKVRFTTRPAGQWDVGRAFRRRIKARFDREGIEIPFPHQTLYWGEDREGTAPPLRVLLTGEDGGPAPPRGAGPGATPGSSSTGGRADR